MRVELQDPSAGLGRVHLASVHEVRDFVMRSELTARTAGVLTRVRALIIHRPTGSAVLDIDTARREAWAVGHHLLEV